MVLRFGFVILAAIAVSGCAVFGGPADRALRRSPSYQQGYSDGCSAADVSANPRDTQGPLTDEDRIYRRGWSGGYRACHHTAAAPGAVPVQPFGSGIPSTPQ